jgi:hypothetical protein
MKKNNLQEVDLFYNLLINKKKSIKRKPTILGFFKFGNELKKRELMIAK